MSPLRVVAPLAALLLPLAACGDDSAPDGAGSDAASDALIGLFAIEPGSCEGSDVTGSWFQMVQSGGTVDDGPYVANADSPCNDQAVTPLAPGADGGLQTGDYQEQPEPAFDDGGGSLAGGVISPTAFFAVRFGISTNPDDPQTGEAVPAPSATSADGALRADLSAVSVSWNGQFFNQGAPKPGADGDGATGTYDAETGAYALDWTSRIEGGPFDGFTGVWHLEGTFEPSGSGEGR